MSSEGGSCASFLRRQYLLPNFSKLNARTDRSQWLCATVTVSENAEAISKVSDRPLAPCTILKGFYSGAVVSYDSGIPWNYQCGALSSY
jgi:hypothetical protein